jgi:hypothetical protein
MSSGSDDVARLTLPQVPPEEAAPCYGEFLAAFPDGRVGRSLGPAVYSVQVMPTNSDTMNPSENTVYQYLMGRGFKHVVYEPDGKVPPDFLVDGHIAIEVRRLNEGEDCGMGHRGLEEVSEPLHKLVTRTLTAIGPSPNGVSWFVHFTYRRPLPSWKSLRNDLHDALTTVKGRTDLQHQEIRVSSNMRLSFIRAGKLHPTLFVLGGSSDHDSGGFVVAELAKNLNVYIAEKTRKVEKARQSYPDWWLAFEDRIAYGGLDENDQADLRKLVRVEAPWSRIILVNPLNPAAGFEL